MALVYNNVGYDFEKTLIAGARFVCDHNRSSEHLVVELMVHDVVSQQSFQRGPVGEKVNNGEHTFRSSLLTFP